ncbi:MAG: hypothetical protein DRN26_01555 [Thermoplasmata archaeon]|nr:MAG: hypothetical protein DRN26_01555 [Thermoplasmata archaeon]
MTNKKFRVEFTFKGEPITKSNAHFAAWSKKHRRCIMYVPAKVKQYEKALYEYAVKAMKRKKRQPTKKLLRMKITYYYGTKRTKDLFNLPKTTADALEKAVYDNDFQIHEAHIYRKLDRKNPRVHIIVEEMSDSSWEKG